MARVKQTARGRQYPVASHWLVQTTSSRRARRRAKRINNVQNRQDTTTTSREPTASSQDIRLQQNQSRDVATEDTTQSSELPSTSTLAELVSHPINITNTDSEREMHDETGRIETPGESRSDLAVSTNNSSNSEGENE